AREMRGRQNSRCSMASAGRWRWRLAAYLKTGDKTACDRQGPVDREASLQSAPPSIETVETAGSRYESAGCQNRRRAPALCPASAYDAELGHEHPDRGATHENCTEPARRR